MKKRKCQKWKWLRYRKRDHAHNLICAAQHYIHQNGGTAVVLGSIGLMDQGGGRYQLCIGALGEMPGKPKEAP